MIAQELTLRHPERVLALILCATSCGGKQNVNSPHGRAFFEASAAVANQPKNQEALLAYVRFQVAPETFETRPDVVERGIDFILSVATAPPHGLALQNQAMKSYVGTHDRLSQIRVPTLVMTGDQDVLMVPENSRILHERIINSELQIVPNTGHSFFCEDPEAFNEALLGFLRRVAKG